MRKRLSVPLLLGALGLVYTLWGSPPSLVTPDSAGPESTEAEPEAYARGVSLRRYGDDGALQEETDAQALRRYGVDLPGGDRVELDAPRRRGHGGDQGWVASARSGEYADGRERLHLSGEVRLRYAPRGLEFRTDAMLIDNARKTARSLAPVRAWQAENETTAEHLFVNLDREVAVLSGNVRSVYQPEP